MTVRGHTGLTLTYMSELTVTRKGAFASIRYEAPVGFDMLRALPGINSQHPKYGGITLAQVKIATEKGKSVATLNYDGEVDSNPSGPAFDVSTTPALREVPIETHPKFQKWAGTAKNPKDGVFEAGRFIGWQPTSKFYGIVSYLSPSVEVSVTRYESNEPDLSDLGTIVNSAQGLPRVTGRRNWMLVSMPYRNSGEGFQVTYVYMLSGKSGWDKEIYAR